MNSIWEQTIPPDEFVLVCDGPLTDELNAVVSEMEKQHTKVLKVLRLDQNRGLGNALNEGLKLCRYDLVARMDSDDISKLDRCEQQLALFMQKPEVDVIGGIVEEFTDDPKNVDGFRAVPEKHSEILRFAKKRNPFNHPCVMYRKTAVLQAGGYHELYLLEDYFLWVRMIMNGAVGYNIQKPLLSMRAGKKMYQRRSGWKYVKSQAKLFGYMKSRGFISGKECRYSIVFRTMMSLFPNSLRTQLYKGFLRK